MRRSSFVFAIAVTVALAACSKSGTDTGGPATTTPPPTVAPATTAGRAAGSASDAGDEVAQFCAKVNANLAVLKSKDSNDFPKFVEALGELETAAPAEVKPDVTTLREIYGAVVKNLDTSALNGDAIQQAGTRFALYVSAKCGVTL